MTHSHSHDHEHDHHHEHPHSHSSSGEMAFEEKMLKILDHWIRHNRDHAATYNDWAERARQSRMEGVAGLLEEAADMNFAMNEKFERAKALIAAAK